MIRVNRATKVGPKTEMPESQLRITAISIATTRNRGAPAKSQPVSPRDLRKRRVEIATDIVVIRIAAISNR